MRFFRIAERRIAEMSGRGIVCYISNFSYLSDPSSVVLRKRLLEHFGLIWIDCLNGDSRETGRERPKATQISIFSTQSNRAGIQVGTAVATMVCDGAARSDPGVRYRSLWSLKAAAVG